MIFEETVLLMSVLVSIGTVLTNLYFILFVNDYSKVLLKYSAMCFFTNLIFYGIGLISMIRAHTVSVVSVGRYLQVTLSLGMIMLIISLLVHFKLLYDQVKQTQKRTNSFNYNKVKS